MSLQGFIGKLQNASARVYLDLANSFVENGLFRDTLVSMAQDKEEQAKCLKDLPARYWNHHKKEESLLDVVNECLKQLAKPRNEPSTSMQLALSWAFDLEEPIILKVYAPLIRHLRTEWTDHALDFYILTKAHVAKLARIAQSFSGNPILIQRSMALLDGFEKAVQTPDPTLFHAKAHELHKKPAREKGEAISTPAGKTRKPPTTKHKAKHALKRRALGNRTKIIPKPPKPPLKKISIARRRARP
jgi:hypothetical protein